MQGTTIYHLHHHQLPLVAMLAPLVEPLVVQEGHMSVHLTMAIAELVVVEVAAQMQGPLRQPVLETPVLEELVVEELVLEILAPEKLLRDPLVGILWPHY